MGGGYYRVDVGHYLFVHLFTLKMQQDFDFSRVQVLNVIILWAF